MPAQLLQFVRRTADIPSANDDAQPIPTLTGTAIGLDTSPSISRSASVKVSEPHSEIRAPENIDLEQLYPASAELNTKLSQALILVSQCLRLMDRAIEYCRAGELMLADDQAHHLLVLLEELFFLRELSEGFASIINSCANGIQNLRGQMLEERQLLALNSCLLVLKKKPFLSFDSSLEVVERLEAAGLNIDAVGVEKLVAWLGDESAS